MSFRPAGFRPAVVGYAVAFVFALSSSVVLAQEAKAPAAAASAAQPAAAAPAAEAAKPAEATAALKPGDAAAGAGKAAACGACHGMDGNSSDAQYPKLAGQHESYIVRQLTDFKSGKRQNPIMLGMSTPLSEQDMHDIGAYFASKSALPGVADQALVERGEQLYRQGDTTKGVPACMACHSIDGRGNPGAMYPQLTSQHAQYIEATLKSWHDGTTWGDDAHAQIMPGIAKKLDEKDITAIASYIEGLHAADGASGASAAK
ncbi:MAG TPA: c-type cytochrome [Dyella sp.]|uniref:c-type cytochrome n=1 Tax=Dyella sp. TaxID=1869338 RepID=UPI002D76D576|nr:c-type cytochrome [Dyella sp.]HET6552152.1 c-type cytochrome [Dyella sp.]